VPAIPNTSLDAQNEALKYAEKMMKIHPVDKKLFKF